MTLLDESGQDSHSSTHEREVLVRVDGVSKKFCRSLKKSLWYGLQDIGSELIGREYEHRLRADEFWSVKDVSFELRRGECLGLIGPNGAGKSTLLKMLNGLIKPDCGRIEISGRVGALIELGTGFNPILTGRENIYNNAAILGFTKEETEERLESIIEFSGIGEFLDTPVQNYSSGMKVRLGFAVAAQLEPDVLIIDEVLAVGDVGFRNKCYSAIDKLVSRSAVILVSHNMEALVRVSNRGLILNRGTVIFDGLPVQASSKYSELFEQTSDIVVKPGCSFMDLQLETGTSNNSVQYAESCKIVIQIHSDVDYKDILFKIVFSTSSGEIAAEFSSKNNNHKVDVLKGKNTLSTTIDNICLLPQKYYISFSLIRNRIDHIFWCRNVTQINVEGNQHGHRPYQLRSKELTMSVRN